MPGVLRKWHVLSDGEADQILGPHVRFAHSETKEPQ